MKCIHAIASSFSSQLGSTEVHRLQACCLPCSYDDRPIIGPVPGVEGLCIPDTKKREERGGKRESERGRGQSREGR